MKALLYLLSFAFAFLAAFADSLADRAADFEWFGTLGFPDVKELRFVRCFYGFSTHVDGQQEEMWLNGFLLEETPEKLRVLTLQFETRDYQKAKLASETDYRVEGADLRACAEAELAPVDWQNAMLARLISGPHFTERTNCFVLGWMCERQGLGDLAERLYARAQTAAGPEQRGTPNPAHDEKGWPFRLRLERDLGNFEMWRTIVAFGNPLISRHELLLRLHALSRRYPHCDHLALTASLAKQLEQMIAEDDAHPARAIKEIAALPSAEQASEFIFRLRDQNGFQMDQPGWVDIFMTVRDRSEQSPAHRLVKLGDAAVPALLAALEDPRLTRSVGYSRDFFFSHHVVTVGEAALTIIEHIADRKFNRLGSRSTAAGRAAARAWWDKRQSKGTLAELAETTGGGEISGASAGAKLLADFPKVAATPILAGAAAAKLEQEKCAFIRLLGKLEDERATAFLLRETRAGPLLGLRAEAAWQLVKRGRLDGIAPLAELWRNAAPSRNPYDASAHRKLIGVLGMSDSPEGIRALAKGLSHRSVEARRHVIEAFGGRTFLLMEFGDYEQHGNAAPVSSAAVASEIEQLLAAELEDTGAHRGTWNFRGNRIDNPRLCDEAAMLMAWRWPARYTFDNEASYPIRERQRIACLNVWRKSHGKPALQLPAARGRVEPGDEFKVVEVVFAGSGIQGPKPLLSVLHGALGREVTSALFSEIERVFLDAYADHAPAADYGFCVDLFRENSTDGITLIASPAERRGPTENRERQWQLGYRAILSETQTFNAAQQNLFEGNRNDTKTERFNEIFRQIAALPAASPFHVHMELAPTLSDVDTAF